MGLDVIQYNKILKIKITTLNIKDTFIAQLFVISSDICKSDMAINKNTREKIDNIRTKSILLT